MGFLLIIANRGCEEIARRLADDLQKTASVYSQVVTLSVFEQMSDQRLLGVKGIVYLVDMTATENPDFEEQVQILVNSLAFGWVISKLKALSCSVKFVNVSLNTWPQLCSTVTVENQKIKELVAAWNTFLQESEPNSVSTSKIFTFTQSFLSNCNLEAEQVKAYASTVNEHLVSQTESSVVIARLGELYGPNVKGSTIETIIEAKLRGMELTMEDEEREFLYIADFARSILALFQCDFSAGIMIVDVSNNLRIRTGGILELVDKMLVTSYGVFNLIAPKTLKQVNRVFRKADFHIGELLDEPTVSFETGLKETVIHQQSMMEYNMSLKDELTCYVGEENELIRVVTGGGSASHLLLLRERSTGYSFVRKIALRDGVEGNGSPKLRKEIEYIQHLRQSNDTLADRYPKILDVQDFGTVVYYDIEYLNNGENLFKSLWNGLSASRAMNLLEDLFEEVIFDHYKPEAVALTLNESYEILESMMLHRAEARTKNLFNTAHNEFIRVLQNDWLHINDVLYENPISILRKIGADPKLKDVFRPRYKSKCIHGDLTIMNILLSNQQDHIVLIDPRGYQGMFDVLYDFGKMKFSISGFAEIIANQYELTMDAENKIQVRMPLTLMNASLRKLNEKFMMFLQWSPSFGVLRDMEPHWSERVTFYAAINYLADIPFRLHTDASPNNSIACFLYGTIYLNRIYQAVFAKVYRQSEHANLH